MFKKCLTDQRFIRKRNTTYKIHTLRAYCPNIYTVAKGYKIVSGGTDNHLILVNLKASKNIDGARVEKICDKVMITLNKNSVPGDKSALNPGGIFF